MEQKRSYVQCTENKKYIEKIYIENIIAYDVNLVFFMMNDNFIYLELFFYSR